MATRILPTGNAYDMKEYKGPGPCAHPDCETVCGEDEHCPGCGGMICEDHDLNFNVTNHPIAEHFDENHGEEW